VGTVRERAFLLATVLTVSAITLFAWPTAGNVGGGAKKLRSPVGLRSSE
jgi:hypothetical protein